MSEIPPTYMPPGNTPGGSGLPPQPEGINLRTILHIVYGLYAIGFITGGLATLAAVILSYVKRGDAAGTIYSSHFDWVLGTFWWSLLWGVLSAIFTLLFIGWIGLFAVVIWVLYRLVKGWLTLAEGKAVART